ncbi:unnamed protein product [Brassica rapa]|uniref:Uncharacterized protein n=1 Tax=Brassica campestris TaxID=3711 RepID=A0A3P6ALX7_BRACM|nr:unnamed protein product [Brassica rapa]VDC86280.1 unnamed protein product [Brassica rapa]
MRLKKTTATMENRGLPFRSILAHSLWITLVGILLFTLSTTKRHNFGYIKFFSISGTLLITLPWMFQLLITSTVIFLYKTKGYNLMWIVRSPKPSNENHLTNVVTISSSSSPLPSGQALKKSDTGEIEIKIVIPKSPMSTHLEIEGSKNSKLLTNVSHVA